MSSGWSDCSRFLNQLNIPLSFTVSQDRTAAGIISVLYKLVHEKVPFEEAMTHLSFKFGHIKAGKTGMLDYFFDAYRQYNAETPIDFVEWVRTKYDREAVSSGFMASWWGSFLTERLLKRE